jgi:hypothetical protein
MDPTTEKNAQERMHQNRMGERRLKKQEYKPGNIVYTCCGALGSQN